MATTYSLIASTQVGAGGASAFDFQNIPSTYTDLVLLLSVRTNRNTYHESLLLKYNNNTSNQSFQRYYIYGAGGPTADQSTGVMYAGQASGGTTSSNHFGVSRVEIFNYSNTSFKKGSESIGISVNNDTTNFIFTHHANRWYDTTTINQITVTPENAGTIQQYSSAYLYGISKS